MKKILIILFLVSISGLCFAQNISFIDLIGNIELYTGMPFMNEWLLYDGRTETLNNDFPSFTFGLGLVNYNFFNDEGLGIYSSLSIHHIKGLNNNLGTETVKFDMPVWNESFDFQAGMAFNFLNVGMFKFPFTVGFHLNYIYALVYQSVDVYWELDRASFGIAFSFTPEIHFNDSVYFFARLGVIMDWAIFLDRSKFTAIDTTEGTAYLIQTDENLAYGIFIIANPVIGIGFKLRGFFNK